MPKKDTKKFDYDVAVIGAGPAGMMAAGKAASLGLKVILVEKNSQPGKKLLLTGHGRCNLTNAEFNLRNLANNYNHGEFLFHAFSVFGPKETIEFFEKLGLKTKIESEKRVFPVSNKAGDVLEALKKYLERNKVEILYNSEIIDVKKTGKKITKIILNDREITAKNYILATGGKSFEKTGSDGFGYKLAENLGHTIIKPSPALAPIRLSALGGPASDWKNLQGISLKNVKITVLQNNKKQFSESGEILFTHFGVTGPAILNISAKVGDLLEKGGTKMLLDLSPQLNQEELLEDFDKVLKKFLKKTIKNILSEVVPERLAEVLLNITKIDGNKIANNMSKIEKAVVVKVIKNFEVTPEDILGFDQAYYTRGGISLREIDHKTMKSKIIANLSFAGEIIDIDAKTGGFNLQMCWSTGYLAGENCK